MDVMPALSALIGGAVGGALSTYLTLRRTRQARLEDAYADFIGAAELARQQSIGWYADQEVAYQETFTRFHHHRARVLLQERDVECRAQIEKVAGALDNLYSKTIRWGETEEEERQHRTEDAVAQLAKMKTVTKEVESLIVIAGRRLSD